MPLNYAPLRGLWLTIALPLAAALTPAPTPAQDTPATFGDVLEVRLVNVEAWVTDSKGKPVRGLNVEDFEIREDGKSVAITHFAEGRGGSSPAAPAIRELPPPDSPLPAVISKPENPGIPQGYLILYFDQLNMRLGGRKRLIQDLRRFIATNEVPPERILLLRQQWDLYTEVPFGSSLDDIDAALTRLASSTALGGQAEMDKRSQIQQLQSFWEDARFGIYSDEPCQWFTKRAFELIDVAARETRERISTSLGHLAHTASFLAGLPGPKTLLYLSDSLETNPGAEFLTFVHHICPASPDVRPRSAVAEDLTESLQRLTHHANANRVTLYTLQTTGLRSGFLGSVEQGDLELGAGASFEFRLRSNERAGLSFLAAETGGRAVFNRNRFGGEFSKIAAEMSSYYSLAYVPTHGGDGREHRIDVRARGRKLRVRHRLSYRDRDADAQIADQLKSALYLGVTNNPHGARLGQGKVRPGDSGGYVLPLHILVPPERIVFVPREGGPVARLKLLVNTRSEHRRGVTSVEKIFHAAPPPEATGQLLDLSIDLALAPGTHAVAVGLRDEATQETSILATTLTIQP